MIKSLRVYFVITNLKYNIFFNSLNYRSTKFYQLYRTYTNAVNTKEKLPEENDKNNESEKKHNEKPYDVYKESPKTLPTIRDPFIHASEKKKGVYLSMVEIFINRDVHKRNHVEFIYSALKHMVDFGVERDLDVYKALINVMPKEKFISRNIFQVEFMHYPKQQQCIIDLLEQMEDFGVMPDYEMESMLLNIFGSYGFPLRKYWRMMYWMPKFKNLSPWPLPNPVPSDALIIAKLAVERMCSVDVRSKVTVYETKDIKDAIDHTWIVSGISPEQNELLKRHKIDKSLYIEGPFMIWLRNRTINYFTLRADPNIDLHKSSNVYEEDEDDVTNLKVPFFCRPVIPQKNSLKIKRSIHEQDDGTIFAICATGTSSKDSLLSWIRLLEKSGNSILSRIPVLFRFRSDIGLKRKDIENGTYDANAINTTITHKIIEPKK